MFKKTTTVFAITLIVVTVILFDVDVNPEFSMPRDVETLDIQQEFLFKECVDKRDRVIHAETFGNIDNPDVQREILVTKKERASRECRAMFPESRVTTSEPFHFNVIDLTFRY